MLPLLFFNITGKSTPLNAVSSNEATNTHSMKKKTISIEFAVMFASLFKSETIGRLLIATINPGSKNKIVLRLKRILFVTLNPKNAMITAKINVPIVRETMVVMESLRKLLSNILGDNI